MPFDVDKAVRYLDSHAHRTTQHRCAHYTTNAITSPAGGGLPMGRTRDAKNFGPLLEAAGFRPVTDGTIQKGDVAVVQPYPGGNQAGHMEMFDGRNWVSDFQQNHGRDVYPGPGYRRNQPDYTIYRYRSGQQSSATGVQGMTVVGTRLHYGDDHGVSIGPQHRHLSHQLAELEGGGKVTQGSGTVFVGSALHPVARVGDDTTDGPIDVGEDTVLVG
ncbi:MAG TPA: hypothetical protein VHB21_21085 [Minicystis sp.]|nr:hypothetical protein [Minicystis sp.]